MILSYDMILENLPRTDRQIDKQTNKQTENSKPEATLIPVDRRGEWANYRVNRSSRILHKKIRKFAQNKQTNKQTDRQTNRQRIQLQRPLLSPVDRRGERANKPACRALTLSWF